MLCASARIRALRGSVHRASQSVRPLQCVQVNAAANETLRTDASGVHHTSLIQRRPCSTGTAQPQRASTAAGPRSNFLGEPVRVTAAALVTASHGRYIALELAVPAADAPTTPVPVSVRVALETLVAGCSCPACHHPATKQRLHNPWDTPAMQAMHAKHSQSAAVQVAVTDGALTVAWPGGARAHRSSYSGEWLLAYAAAPPQQQQQVATEVWLRMQAAVDPLSAPVRAASRIVWTPADLSPPLPADALPRTLPPPTLLPPTPTPTAAANTAGSAAAAATLHPLPQVHYEAYMHSAAGLYAALRCLRDYGFVRVEGCPVTMAATEAVCRRAGNGRLRGTIYGPGMWTTHVEPPAVGAASATADTAFTAEPLPPHTDGCYFQDTPGVQVFHCLQADASGGGASQLVDGYAALRLVEQRLPATAGTAATTATAAKQQIQQMQQVAPVHPSELVLSYHHTDASHRLTQRKRLYDRVEERFHWNPVDLIPPAAATAAATDAGAATDAVAEAARVVAGVAAWNAAVNHPFLSLWFPLQPGTVLIFDNTRLLHGRAGFSPASRRTLAGAYIDRDDWQGAMRAAHAALGLGPRDGYLWQ